jgi:hypothetical protein
LKAKFGCGNRRQKKCEARIVLQTLRVFAYEKKPRKLGSLWGFLFFAFSTQRKPSAAGAN